MITFGISLHIVFQVKQISDDVNLKTVDHVMAGVESIIGGFSRFLIKEKIRNWDAKYTKKWLIREDAVDLMALKYEEISLDEHYARLYGPRILVHENKINEMLQTDSLPNEEISQDNAKPERKKSLLPERVKSWQRQPSKTSQTSTYIERKQLQQAFSSNPYERFKHKNFRDDSEEHVIEQIQKQREARTKAIWSTALTKITTANNGDENEDQVPGSDQNIPSTSTSSSGKRPKSLFTFGDAADTLLQKRGQIPQIRRGESYYGDGQRLRQVYCDAFLRNKNTGPERHSIKDEIITENETQEDIEEKSSKRDGSHEKHR